MFTGSTFKSFSAIAILIISSLSFASQDFPRGPDATMTPGALCSNPTTYRYPEHIPYCQRNVASDEKRAIFRAYDSQLGYHTQAMPRMQFKIDHYIPLCAGGANTAANLWPQHVSIYTITDPLEPLLCEKMAQGVLSQAKAVELVKRAKNDLSQVRAVMSELSAM